MTGPPRSPGSRHAPRADEATVRALLRSQVPTLADRPLVPGPTGWDNTHWLLGGDLAVRLPRRRTAVALVANEVRCLTASASSVPAVLPLAVPAPVHVGVPEGDWPWPWTVIPWFAGERADLAYPPADAAAHAAALARFLAALHVPAPADAPFNPYRSVDLADRAARSEEAFAVLAQRGGDDRGVAVLRRVWERGLRVRPHAGPRVWIHGDLHPGNQLVADGRLAAVVDWGDVAAGDPAADLATAWWTLPVEAHATFWATYGTDGEVLRHRSAAWAAAIALYLLKEGPAVGDAAILSMARRTVVRLDEAG